MPRGDKSKYTDKQERKADHIAEGYEKRGVSEKEAPIDDKKILQGVQRKLRKRSKGKFYGDGWSTSQSRLNYALIAAVMLVTIVAVYLALGPTGISLR